jgi:hypothetical protein
MQSENANNENERDEYQLNCEETMPLDCEHRPLHGKTVATPVPDGYDYSHLVGDPVKQHDKGSDTRFDAALFDLLLTDYDRILLQFGMHILG